MLFLSALLAASTGALAQSTDDGFIWIDANTRIKVKPTSAAGGASAPEKEPKAPQRSKTDAKKDKPRK
ncbi:MAG: hypothetical protein K0R40_133 [Burkholderiales bacterium]|nr:hypothetical protein [Burkholderiales bacterium]